MPSLLIRDIPKEAYAMIKEHAAKNRRSIGKEALVMLEHELEQYKVHRFDPASYRPPKVKFLKKPDFSPEAVVAATHDGWEE